MNFFSYRGRIGRQKYIIGLIVATVLSAIIGFLYFFIALSSLTLVLSKAGFLAVIFVFLLGFVVSLIPIFLTSTVIVKRFHDVGKSGWWWFALLIPIYDIHLAIGLLTEMGTTGPNPYGEDTLPTNTPDDIFNRFSHNNAARLIADVLVISLCLLFFVLSAMDRVKQQTTQQNIINQIVQSAACGDSTSTPDQLITPDKTWKTYTFSPSIVNGSSTSGFGKFSFQYPTAYNEVKNINLLPSPMDSVGIISDSPNVQYSGLVDIYANVFEANSQTLDQILSANESQKNISEIKDFKTNSGIVGKEMVLKMDNRSACWGYDIRAKIAFMLPQNKSGGKPAVIVFDTKWDNAYQNSLVESVAKTFAETNTGSAVTVFINPGAPLANFSFLQLKMTGNNNWPPSISNPVCFSIEYPEKLVPQDWGYLDTMAQGDVDFYDTESNSRKIDLMPSMSNGFDSEIEYLKAVNSPNKISKTQDLTTDGGLKGKEVIYESGSWVVFILTTETYQGSYLVFKLSGGSSYLEDGENMAKSLKLDSSCPVQ